MKPLFITTVLTTFLLAGCASQRHKTQSDQNELITSILPGATLLIGFNRNEDYQIDKNEFISGRQSSFENADLNSNGVINPSEFRAWHAKAIGVRGALPNFYHFDRNFNDLITRSEFNSGLDRLFASADKNNDEVIGFYELVSLKVPPVQRSRPNSIERGNRDQKRRR